MVREEFETEIEIFIGDLSIEIEDLRNGLTRIEQYFSDKGISFESDREYNEIKNLIEIQDFEGLLKRKTIRNLLSSIKRELCRKYYSSIKGIEQTNDFSRRKAAKVILDENLENEAQSMLKNVLWDSESRGSIDYSEASTLKVFRNYIIATARGIIIDESDPNSQLEPKDKRNLNEFKRFKGKLESELERKVCFEEAIEHFKKHKKASDKYCEYIQSLILDEYTLPLSETLGIDGEFNELDEKPLHGITTTHDFASDLE